MFYPKNADQDLSSALFQSPTKEYRGAPFWSWNDELEIPELLRQIRWMKENCIGGFFMHARGGLKTPYLSEKWMRSVEACWIKMSFAVRLMSFMKWASAAF